MPLPENSNVYILLRNFSYISTIRIVTRAILLSAAVNKRNYRQDIRSRYNGLPIPADIVHRIVLRTIKMAIISGRSCNLCRLHSALPGNRRSFRQLRWSLERNKTRVIYLLAALTRTILRVAFRLWWRRVGD